MECRSCWRSEISKFFRKFLVYYTNICSRLIRSSKTFNNARHSITHLFSLHLRSHTLTCQPRQICRSGPADVHFRSPFLPQSRQIWFVFIRIRQLTAADIRGRSADNPPLCVALQFDMSGYWQRKRKFECFWFSYSVRTSLLFCNKLPFPLQLQPLSWRMRSNPFFIQHMSAPVPQPAPCSTSMA